MQKQQGTQRTVVRVSYLVTGLVTFGHYVAVFAVVRAQMQWGVYLLQVKDPCLKCNDFSCLQAPFVGFWTILTFFFALNCKLS